MSKKTSKKTKGGAKFVKRPQQFDCIQFHGPEDFDDGVLAEWLKKYEIKARITGPLDFKEDGTTPNGEIILELYPQRSYQQDEPLAVWENCWIVVENERMPVEILGPEQFEKKYMAANKHNS